jgi:hypothetical protein
MKKMTLFTNSDNYKIRLQTIHNNDVMNPTNECTSIISYYQTLPSSMLRNGNTNTKRKVQDLLRKLKRNISLDNVFAATDENYLLAFDVSKSIMICYDFTHEVLFAASISSAKYKKTKTSYIYNSDAIKIYRTTVKSQFYLTEFIDPREDEKLVLHRQYQQQITVIAALEAENEQLRSIIDRHKNDKKVTSFPEQQLTADTSIEQIEPNNIVKQAKIWSERYDNLKNGDYVDKGISADERLTIICDALISLKSTTNIETADNLIRSRPKEFIEKLLAYTS